MCREQRLLPGQNRLARVVTQRVRRRSAESDQIHNP